MKENDVKAEYRDGILEVRLPAPKAEVDSEGEGDPYQSDGQAGSGLISAVLHLERRPPAALSRQTRSALLRPGDHVDE